MKTETMTKEEWINKCAGYMIGLGVDKPLARGEAEAWIEDNPGDIEDDPTAVAEDIMSYWTAD